MLTDVYSFVFLYRIVTALMWNTEDIYIAELGYTMGQTWIALKKSLRQLKYNLTIGDHDRIELELATFGHEKRGNLVKSIYLNAQ